ncbi:MAG TPA: type III pantothenate kinase [Candidatus Eisenbacteria bacterium]|jgi:type III pantothenate kinase|nr:type III pantothenate kinase [Candidatus Eisenbacteria bacterium]
MRRKPAKPKPVPRGKPLPGSSLLVVDLGNSETVIGLFTGERLTSHWRVGSVKRTADEVALLVRSLTGREPGDPPAARSVLCSVVPTATRDFALALENITGRPPLVVDQRTVRGLAVRYQDPSVVGPDRLANAVAARALYGTPAVVVDLGTATTFDVVGPRGDYVGGAIAPGVITSSEELFRRAARLSRVELELPERAIGRNTQESLQAGILLGTAGMVDALVRRITRELGKKPHVIATGGLAPIVAPACETVDRVDEWLTLHGLRLIEAAAARPSGRAKRT